MCNGNPARVSGARCLGWASIATAFLISVLLTLSGKGRGWRAFGAAFLVVGLCAVVASYRGMCICMYSMNHHRHIRPWELFVDAEPEPEKGGMVGNGAAGGGGGMGMQKRSFDSFGSSNSFEDEPWVVEYQNKSLTRKIFDKEAWIQEPAIRAIQDIIFIQSSLVGLLAGGVFVTVFVLLPSGDFF